MDTSKMSPAEIRRAAMEAVVREVGATGLVCLLRDGTVGTGNYVTDREKWLPAFDTSDALMDAISREGRAGSGR